MKRALTFYLLLAGWSLCHAKDETYELGFNYIRANQNEPAAIETEIRASSFWKECLLNLDLPANTPRPFQFQMKVLPNGDFVLTTPDDLAIVRNEASGTFKFMLTTYVRSRALGMTPALSKERTFLIHGKKSFKPSLRRGQEDIPKFEKYYGLPLDRLHRADDTSWLLEEVEGWEYHVLSDGDLSIIFVVDEKDRWSIYVRPMDSRLLRNPGMASWLGTKKKEVAARLDKLKDALGVDDEGVKDRMSREYQMYWKALREIVEETHFKPIPFDTIEFRTGLLLY